MTSPTNDVPEAQSATKSGDARRILQLRVPVIAVLAEKRMKLAEVLNFGVGSIIQLDKPSDDLLDLLVSDQRVGRGETVRIGDNFGLQIVEIGPVHDTIRKLGGDAETQVETSADDAEPE